MKNDDSQVKLRDDKVVWVINGRTKFSIPITDIKVIGEFTTDNGPYLEDWFLTIITLGDWYEIPMDTNGVDKLLIDLGQKLGTFLSCRLANSADWRTRIIYPEDAKDQELYGLVEIKPKNFWERIKKSIGLQDTARQFSATTKEIIKK